MDLPLLYLILSLLALLFSAYFSGTETGFISLSKIRIRYLSMQGNKNARRIENMLKHPESFLSTVLIGNNIMNVLFTSFFTIMISSYIDQWAIPMITAGIILICGEIVPKSLYREFPQTLSLHSVRGIAISYWLLFPFIKIVSIISNFLINKVKSSPQGIDYIYTRQGISQIIQEGHKSGAVEPEELEIISRVFTFREIMVGQVMTPKGKIVAVEKNATFKEVKTLIVESGFSRIPVYEKDKNNIVGIMHAYDVLANYKEHDALTAFIKPVYFVLNHKKCDSMLREFQNLKSQIAIVINENHTVLGLISLEDILERLVGDISDEHDQPQKSL